MNILEDQIFTVKKFNGSTGKYSLPEVYELLYKNEVDSFEKLQSHQEQGWHCFLAQTGAIVTENTDEIPKSKETWKNLLESAVPTKKAWNVRSESLSDPAFMQPPTPNSSPEDFDKIDVTEYDVPILSKNHSLKTRRIRDPDIEHWLYMIVNIQTTTFYGGQGNYGISRMNSNIGNRVFLSLTPSLKYGEWIMSDIDSLRKNVDTIKGNISYEFNEEYSPFLWTIPWNGEEKLDINNLHPLYIDIARIIRNIDGQWMKKTTDDSRIKDNDNMNGRTGDPWAPVNIKDNKVPSIPKDVDYRKLQKYLFSDDYNLPVSFDKNEDGYVVCRVVSGTGMGNANLDFQRIVKYETSNKKDEFGIPKPKSEVARESEIRIKESSKAVDILSESLNYIIPADPTSDRSQDLKTKTNSSIRSRIDNVFFDKLYEADELEKKTRREFWQDKLVKIIYEEFEKFKNLGADSEKWERTSQAVVSLESSIKEEFGHATEPYYSQHVKESYV